jgi:hypothetical protein
MAVEFLYDRGPGSAEIAKTQIGRQAHRSSLPEEFGTTHDQGLPSFEAKSSRDIALFLDALLSVASEPEWREQFSAPGVHEWVNGTLQARWNAARESVLAAIFPSGRRRMFIRQPERRAKVDAEVTAAGQRVVRDWMVKSKLVSDTGVPLKWLMLLINHGLKTPSHRLYELLRQQIRDFQHPPAPALGPWPDFLPDLVPIQHLERLPDEKKKTDWNRRMLEQVDAARERRAAAKLPVPLSEPTKSGNNHQALILALCGVSWARIFDHYKKDPECKWNSNNSAQHSAQEFALRLGLKWPLAMKSGRPRKG